MFGKMTIPSLPVNDPDASHRIVGRVLDGGGILGYYRRDVISDALREFLEIDPNAEVRVEPHNPNLMGAALRSTDVEWIVNNAGELGVKIGEQFFFLYNGESFMYSSPKEAPSQYRRVGKREFGESGPITTRPFDESEGWRKINKSTARNGMQCFNHDEMVP